MAPRTELLCVFLDCWQFSVPPCRGPEADIVHENQPTDSYHWNERR